MQLNCTWESILCAFFGVLIVQNFTILYLPCHPPPYDTKLSDLRDFAMRFFSAGVSGRSALLSGGQCPGQQNVDQCSLSLWRSGACLERRWIAEYAGNATNDRLKTANEAAAMDEAEMATPDALD